MTHSIHFVLFYVLFYDAILTGNSLATDLPSGFPDENGFVSEKLQQIVPAVEKALSEKLLSGCVVCVGRNEIVYLKAFGDKKTDTIFDLASVTKPVATATSIMFLADQGKLNIDAPVRLYLDEFNTSEKKDITIRQLLTHTAGFPQGPGGPFNDPDEFLKRVLAMKPQSPPGEKYVYSCGSYIILGEIIHRISGQNLNEFTRQNIFQPLGMNDTGFIPNEVLTPRIAPLTNPNREPGKVHDFQAFALGGIAGNAGLFSTAEDLAVFCKMMLNKGQIPNCQQILKPETVALMTAPNKIPDGVRGLGWTMQMNDVHRPKKMSAQAYGHGGFTGTAIWIDPKYGNFVIFLSNRPNRVVYPLVSEIGDIVIDAVKQ
jgi:CubicO group peptidase (beta-lactamase class C family)